MREQITPLILTYNEAPNIRRTLSSLAWASEVLVVDSFSSDETLDIVREFPRTRVLQRAFDTFASQCNFGLQNISTEWVLSLDADYVVTDALNSELAALDPDQHTAGYSVGFVYCILGHPLRASLYPPRTVLYRRASAAYVDDGHGHRVQVGGAVRPLSGKILHDDRKPLERWFAEQNRYAVIEANKLQTSASDALNFPDRLRKTAILGPVLVFLYTLLGRGLILDGWPGWFYVFQRTLAEIILSLRLIEARLTSGRNSRGTRDEP